MTREDAHQLLRRHDIKFVLAQFVDLHGVAKTKAVPAAHFDDVLDAGAGFAGFAVWGMGQQPHDPDFMAVGDLATLSPVPWQPGYARIVCDGRVDGQPWPYDTRHVLKEQLRALGDRGYQASDFPSGDVTSTRRLSSGLEPVDDPRMPPVSSGAWRPPWPGSSVGISSETFICSSLVRSNVIFVISSSSPRRRFRPRSIWSWPRRPSAERVPLNCNTPKLYLQRTQSHIKIHCVQSARQPH